MPVITGPSLKVLIYTLLKGKRNLFKVYFKSFTEWWFRIRINCPKHSAIMSFKRRCNSQGPMRPCLSSSSLKRMLAWPAYSFPFLCALKFSKPSLWNLQNKIEEGKEKLEKKDVRGGERVGGLQDIYWCVTEVCVKGEIEYFKRVLRPICGFWNTQEKE